MSAPGSPRASTPGGRETPGPMRILAATGPLLMTPLDWTFEVIAEAGYEGVEVMISHAPESRDPDAVRALAERAGLAVPVVHGPYLLLLRTVLGANYVEKTRRSLALAAAIGAQTMVAHAPFRWERGARNWLAEDVGAEAAEAGTTFAMENLFPVAGQHFSSAISPRELTEFPSVVFDTSHFGVAGVDLLEAWEILAERVVHLHVSDNLGNGRDSHAPIGSGVLPLERFLATVAGSAWSGTVTLELDCRPYLDSREKLVRFLAAEREKAVGLLAGRATVGVEAPTTG